MNQCLIFHTCGKRFLKTCLFPPKKKKNNKIRRRFTIPEIYHIELDYTV